MLAFVAGMINLVGLLGFRHQAVTHVTGSTSLLSAAIADADGIQVIHLTAIIASFVAGAALSGIIVQDSTLRLGRRYGVALLIESALLAGAVPLLNGGHVTGMLLASAASGLQNAMASAYSGAVVRTTHVSGMLTDLGIMAGHALRRLPVDRRRIGLYLSIVGGFLAGGIAGTLCFRHWGYSSLSIPAAITGCVALAYGLKPGPPREPPAPHAG